MNKNVFGDLVIIVLPKKIKLIFKLILENILHRFICLVLSGKFLDKMTNAYIF